MMRKRGNSVLQAFKEEYELHKFADDIAVHRPVRARENSHRAQPHRTRELLVKDRHRVLRRGADAVEIFITHGSPCPEPICVGGATLWCPINRAVFGKFRDTILSAQAEPFNGPDLANSQLSVAEIRQQNNFGLGKK